MSYEKEIIYKSYDAGVGAMDKRGVSVRALCDVDDWFVETFPAQPIEFDAKKVAEEMYDEILEINIKILGKHSLTPIIIIEQDIAKNCAILSLNRSHYTPAQRQQILTELKKM